MQIMCNRQKFPTSGLDGMLCCFWLVGTPQLTPPFFLIAKEISDKIIELRCTEFNLAAGIFALCLFLTRQLLAMAVSISTRMEVYLLSCVLLFWTMSCIGQRSPDYSDADHPSRMPWYLEHSCSIASTKNQAACYVAQASYALTIVLMWGSFYLRQEIMSRTNCCFLRTDCGTHLGFWYWFYMQSLIAALKHVFVLLSCFSTTRPLTFALK